MIMAEDVIHGMKDGYNEVGEVHELFCIREEMAPVT
jgi:hypothetical protein